MDYKKLFFFAILSGMTLIAGCDDKKGGSENRVETPANLTEQNKKAQEILKYNAYVDVSNYQSYANLPYGEDFANQLLKQKQFMADYIKKDKPLDNYSNLRKDPISGKIERLEKAVAINASLPKLDNAAATYLQQLKTLQPLNDELSLYADTKEYLIDKGDLFKQKGPRLIAQIEEVIKAENAFQDEMTQHDNQLVKAQFESSEKNSLAYFRNGVIYYEKIISHDMGDQLDQVDNDTLARIDANTNTLADLMKSYDKMKSVSSNTCTSDITRFIASSRSMTKKMRDDAKHYLASNDAYSDELKASSPVYRKLSESSAESDFENLMSHFSSLIDNMNANRC